MDIENTIFYEYEPFEFEIDNTINVVFNIIDKKNLNI